MIVDANTPYAIVGRIRRAHGIRGQVTVELLTDEPGAIFAPGRRVFAGTVDGDLAPDPAGGMAPQALRVETAEPFKGGLIVSFDAIQDRTIAERWRSRYLLVPMSELTPPGEDEVFVHELVGLAVVSREGATLGTVVGTYELPQGLTLEVKTAAGDVLLPYRSAMIDEVDLSARTVTVDAESGLWE
jgi:16S rRNA processing protein RimM